MICDMVSISHSVLIQQIDFQHRLYDLLQKHDVLTIDDPEENVSKSEPETWNRVVLSCLTREISYNKFVRFLELMEETCQTHLVNYMVNLTIYHPCFGKKWILDRNIRNRINQILGRISERIDLDYTYFPSPPIRNGEDKIGIDGDNNETDNTILDLSALPKVERKVKPMKLSSVLKSKCLITTEQETIFDVEHFIHLLLNGSVESYETIVDYFHKTGMELAACSITPF